MSYFSRTVVFTLVRYGENAWFTIGLSYNIIVSEKNRCPFSVITFGNVIDLPLLSFCSGGGRRSAAE